MKRSLAQPRYLTVAVDLARRVASGEFKVGQQLSGRSLLASQYEVSPETIRRALSLLAEMDVVEVRPQSGTTVLSAENASQYVSYFEKDAGARKTYDNIRELLERQRDINQKLSEAVDAFAGHRVSLSAVNSPLPNYEIPIPDDSALIGTSIGEVKFWGLTGCTIVAIRRDEKMLLSPGPYAQFQKGDSVVLVGTPAAAERATILIQQRHFESTERD